MNFVFPEGKQLCIQTQNNIQSYADFSELFTHNDDSIHLKSQIPYTVMNCTDGLVFRLEMSDTNIKVTFSAETCFTEVSD